MKYLLLLVCMWLLSGCRDQSSEFEELNRTAAREVKTTCDEIGGTLAFGMEVSYAFGGVEVTNGYYCINTKNPTGEIS